jgi:hypothetical protein
MNHGCAPLSDDPPGERERVVEYIYLPLRVALSFEDVARHLLQLMLFEFTDPRFLCFDHGPQALDLINEPRSRSRLVAP